MSFNNKDYFYGNRDEFIIISALKSSELYSDPSISVHDYLVPALTDSKSMKGTYEYGF